MMLLYCCSLISFLDLLFLTYCIKSTLKLIKPGIGQDIPTILQEYIIEPQL
jgi:hypothetical protein